MAAAITAISGLTAVMTEPFVGLLSSALQPIPQTLAVGRLKHSPRSPVRAPGRQAVEQPAQEPQQQMGRLHGLAGFSPVLTSLPEVLRTSRRCRQA